MPMPEWIVNIKKSLNYIDFYDGLDLITALTIAIEALEYYGKADNYNEEGAVMGRAFYTPSTPNGPEEWDYDLDMGEKAENALEEIRKLGDK